MENMKKDYAVEYYGATFAHVLYTVGQHSSSLS